MCVPVTYWIRRGMAGSCFDLTFQRPIGLFIIELVTCINTTANSDLARDPLLVQQSDNGPCNILFLERR